MFFRVDMTKLDSFIEARARFLTLSDEVQSNESIIVQVDFLGRMWKGVLNLVTQPLTHRLQFFLISIYLFLMRERDAEVIFCEELLK